MCGKVVSAWLVGWFGVNGMCGGRGTRHGWGIILYFVVLVVMVVVSMAFMVIVVMMTVMFREW